MEVFNMAYRNKTYVCFDADNDMNYYSLMKAWKQNDNTNFDFYNAHDLNNLRDGSSDDTIKRKLWERLLNTKFFVILIGEHTKNLYKFVRWEIEQALSLGLPIIAVNLNGKRRKDDELCPPIIRDELAVHVSFQAAIMQKSLESWGIDHDSYKKQGKTGAFHYPDSVYKDLGL
jgi:hypothetical protein